MRRHGGHGRLASVDQPCPSRVSLASPSHASIIIWSFCNEAGCEGSQEDGAPRFREITYEIDGSRPVLANMFSFGGTARAQALDVAGRPLSVLKWPPFARRPTVLILPRASAR